jgi:hypothetical protein
MPTSGALFDGSWKSILNNGIIAAKEAIADNAIKVIKSNLDDVLIQNTGNYMSTIHSQGETDDLVVTDGTVYGPWLEGVGSRNLSTRFKGYWTFRQSTEELKNSSGEIANAAIEPYIESINA